MGIRDEDYRSRRSGTPIGEPGEVLLRGDGMMRGYYKDPAGTAAALDAEGWLHTGDLAYQDEDGYFFVVGRSKELIIKGGMNIAPKQIDEILESHPAVLEAAAVGVPDRYVGEDVVAFAVLRDGMSCDEGELLSFCESRLGHFKTPSRIHFVRDLPKGPSGKVQRLKLQEDLAERSFSLTASGVQDQIRSSDEAQASSAQIEKIIAETWANLLKLPSVDPQSNFFSLGGHSLLAIQCLARLRNKLTIRMSLSDFFENPTIAEQAALIRSWVEFGAGSSADASASLRPDLSHDAAPSFAAETIPPRDRSRPCPLSPNQRRLWFMELVVGGEPVYNEAEAVRLNGELKLEVLEGALNAVIARHENLRTSFRTIDNEPTTFVHDGWRLQIKQIDLSSLTPAQREAEAARLLIDEPRRPYKLDTEPAIRVTLLNLGPTEHILILMMHHIICDWGSTGNLWRDLSASYRAGCRGLPLELSVLPIQHGDYAVWQHDLSSRAEFAEDLAYWQEKLRGAPALLQLPTDRPRPPVLSYRGARRRFQIPTALTQAVRDCSRKEKVSLFAFFATTLNVLLYRYTGQDDILLGIPLSDRDRPELQTVIGFLLHTHVLRTRLDENLRFRELLLHVQKDSLDLYAHRSPPFDEVVSALQPARSSSYSPFFQVGLNWRDRDQLLSVIGLEGLEVELVLAESRTAKFDLTLMLTDGDDSIDLEIEYNTDLFDEARIERMVGHFGTVLEAAVADTDRRLSELPLLTDAELQQLVVDWNRMEVAYPQDRCLHQLFEEQVDRTPDATAVVFEHRQLTYRELNQRANQLARYLQKLGVGSDALVAICVERSLEMVVGLLGVLKAGGAYVPLDPSYPSERLEFMLADTGSPILLTLSGLQHRLLGCDRLVLRLDADWPLIAGEIADNVASAAKIEQLAYMIYTSGSTGRPKGVMIPHRAIVNHLRWMQSTFPLDNGDSVLQKYAISFDPSVWECFAPLIAGARLVIASAGGQTDPEYLVQTIVDQGITVLQLVPSQLRMLLEVSGFRTCTTLRRVFVGGEVLDGDLAARFHGSINAELYNLYGPTEATIASTFFLVPHDHPTEAVPIGRPIANTQLYVVDIWGQPVPIGVRGELLIGGDGLARGYHNRLELTAEKFIPDGFRSEPGARLYMTGDLVRYQANGTIEYLGRLDNQVKI